MKFYDSTKCRKPGQKGKMIMDENKEKDEQYTTSLSEEELSEVITEIRF